MTSTWLLILMRLVHILAGVFWVGAMLFMQRFVMPTAQESGLEGRRFMQRMMQARKVTQAFGAAAGLTMLSGIGLYWRFTAITDGAWARSRPGMVFGLGGAAAIIAGIIGGSVVGGAAEKMTALGATMEAGGPPPAGAAEEMQRLQARMQSAAKAVQWLLILAVICMATARYF
jgi:hypothetical protein